LIRVKAGDVWTCEVQSSFEEDAMNVEALMSRNTISVLPTTTITDAARIMLANHVSGLPVLDAQGALVGVITEGDLLRRTELETDGKKTGWLRSFLMPSAVAADYVATHSRHVSGVMSHNAVFVSPETELLEVAQLMQRKHIKRLPVLKDGRLVGVISRTDLLRVLARKLIEKPEECSDEAIGAYIKTELTHASWVPRTGIRIKVKDKVVHLEGTIFSDQERQAVHVIAENAPGVKQIEDELVYVDPGTGLTFPATD
jgi:CBS domain-containing protein